MWSPVGSGAVALDDEETLSLGERRSEGHSHQLSSPEGTRALTPVFGICNPKCSSNPSSG